MSDATYDVFISYSQRDLSVVLPIVERLKADGLRVWFAAREIEPGESFPNRIDEGLARSRKFVLCTSSHATDWTKAEFGAVAARDPLNKKRRVLLLQLDDHPVTGLKSQYARIKWNDHEPDQAYWLLFGACLADAVLRKFHKVCADLSVTSPSSERKLLGRLLSEIDTLLKEEAFNLPLLHAAILWTVSTIQSQRSNYPLLKTLKTALEECLSEPEVSARDLQGCIRGFRTELTETLNTLAARGALNIATGDKVLLYAHSDTVIATINKWLADNPGAKLDVYICECRGKPATTAKMFGHALASADEIPHSNARIYFALDSTIGRLISTEGITKVFFGAHQWSRSPDSRVWFTNTQGTLAIAATATKYRVPVFVFVEEAKSPRRPQEEGARADPQIPHKHWPTKTKYGLPIEYRLYGYDEIHSESIPFLLVTETGEFSCADCDLRKRNSVEVERAGLSVRKRTIDRVSALSEQVALEVLNASDIVGTQTYRAPRLVPDAPDARRWASVSMHHIAGVRMHDLIATMNAVARRSEVGLSQTVAEFNANICNWAIGDVHTWQSDPIQTSLRNGFGNHHRPYEFESKLIEAVRYILGLAGTSHSSRDVPQNEIEALASRLGSRAKVFLRDATLKNQILDINRLLGAQLTQQGITADYFPPVNRQWNDEDVASLLLRQLPQGVSWESIRANLWQVDFELASKLTTPEDDFVHILALEVFSLSYDEIVERVVEQCGSKSPNHVHEIMLFRCLRAWARRLFYKREEPETFAMRYSHETLGHYRRLAQLAAGKLESSLGSGLLRIVQD